MATREVVDYQLTAAELTADQRRRAVLTVASSARDAAECVELLEMLGLSATESFPDIPAPRM